MKKTVGFVVRHLVLTFLVIIWLVPILWLVVTSFSGYKGINTAHFFPETWSLDNYKVLFLQPDSVVQYGAWFKNTLLSEYGHLWKNGKCRRRPLKKLTKVD